MFEILGKILAGEMSRKQKCSIFVLLCVVFQTMELLTALLSLQGSTVCENFASSFTNNNYNA